MSPKFILLSSRFLATILVKCFFFILTFLCVLHAKRYEEDIAKHLDGKSLVMLGTTNKWFHCLIMEDSIWKFACLRDLQLPEPQHTFLNWIKLYASAFGNEQGVKFSPYFSYVMVLIVDQYHHLLNDCLADGSHSFMFRQREKHIGNCPSLFTVIWIFLPQLQETPISSHG